MLLLWWRYLFSGCDHEWSIYRKVDIYCEDYKNPVGFEYHLRCKHCGDMKKRKF